MEQPTTYPNLKAYLDATGRTQAEFAEAVGCKQPTISQILSGQKAPSFSLAMRIAREARIPVESLWRDGETA